MATIKKAVITKDGNSWRYVFGNGKSIVASLDELSAEIIFDLTMHGLKQKLSDSYSGKTLDYEIEAEVRAVWETLVSGQWNAGRSSAGGIWVEAIARAAGSTIEEAQTVWTGLDEATQKDVKKDTDVRLAKAQIEMERAQAKAKGTKLDLSSLK